MMKSNHKIRLALFSTVGLTVALGWIYQHASGTLCYSKLAFIYAGNIAFWMASIRPVGRVFARQLKTTNLFRSLLSIGFLTLLFNQLIVYFFVEGLFAAFFSCESNILLSELILTNGLLSNFIAFFIIIIGTNYDSVLQKFRKEPSEENGKSNPICIKQNGSTHLIRPHEIVKVEADNNAVNIHTSHKRFVQYGRLKDWEVQFKAAGLIRVHRSFIVNKNYIQAYQSKPSGDGVITLATGEKVKVSRNYRSNLYSQGQLLTGEVPSQLTT